MDKGKIFWAGAKNHCAPDATMVVAKENRSKYLGINKKREADRLYLVDGEIVRDKATDRCDYLLLNDDRKEAYFIELKSAKIEHALDQIDCTIRMAKSSLSEYELFKRIVFNGKTTVGVMHSRLICERIKAGKAPSGRERFVYKRALMEESLNEDF